MPRRLKLKTDEIGFQELYLIYETGGVWEPDWAPFQGHPITALFATVSKETMDHALHGWTRPLVNQLGPAPNLLLRKLPFHTCALRRRCSLYQARSCIPTHPKMPLCFQPDGTDDETGLLASEAIRLWREGVYVIVVVDAANDGRQPEA